MSKEEEILRVPEVLSLEEQRDLYRELLKSKEEEINDVEEWNGMDTFFDMFEEYR